MEERNNYGGQSDDEIVSPLKWIVVQRKIYKATIQQSIH